MIDTQALLAQLDRRLDAICVLEEQRAVQLAGGPGSGWSRVRRLLDPTVVHQTEVPDLPPAVLPDASPDLAALTERLGLSPLERDILVVLLAPHLGHRYRTLYGVLQDDLESPFPTERLLQTVLGSRPADLQAVRQALSSNGRLIGAGWLWQQAGHQPAGMGRLDLAPVARDALLGLPPPNAVDGFALETWHSEGSEAAPAGLSVIHGTGDPHSVVTGWDAPEVRVLVAEGSARELVEQARALWRVGLAWSLHPVLDLRDQTQDTCRTVASRVAAWVERFGGRLTVVTRHALPQTVPHFRADADGFRDRLDGWTRAASASGAHLEPDDARVLASATRATHLQATEILRALPSGSLDDRLRLATRIAAVPIPFGTAIHPTRTFDDIVLAPPTRAGLDRLVYFARHRDQVAEEWQLQHRYRLDRGPVALFSGKSGTGKTLAAEVVAQSLGRPLHVVDLSQMVSKWIGETEKHIDQVLAAGQASGAVIFFDEAESLFSQRTEVGSSNDRYANLEVGYLLQRIETHDGLVILATNLRQSIDEAFLRRFHTRVEFPVPSPPQRAAIWQMMIPESVPRTDLDLQALADAHELAGGAIRNAALKALFLASRAGVPLDQQHLERALALERLELGHLTRVDLAAGQDSGAHLRAAALALASRLGEHLRGLYLKEVSLVHGAPTKEKLAGKRPAISLSLLGAARSRGALRATFVLSPWSSRAEEEHELLGVVQDWFRATTKLELDGADAKVEMSESNDFELLHRYWSSHNHPVRASAVVDLTIG